MNQKLSEAENVGFGSLLSGRKLRIDEYERSMETVLLEFGNVMLQPLIDVGLYEIQGRRALDITMI